MILPTTLELRAGYKVRVCRMGHGPPIVLLHGYPDNLQIWSAVAPLLANRFEVIAFDWPGMGDSDPWPGGATPFHMADHLRALLDEWALAKAIIVGIDMGGQPALAFAAQWPERCARLVVMNSLVMPEERTSWEIRVLRKFGWNRLILNRLPGLVFRRALRTFLPEGQSLPDDVRADFWGAFRQPAVRRFISRMCAGYQGKLPALARHYKHIAVPTLILWGEHDRHFPPSHAEALHTAIPGSCREIIPGASHWMPLQMPNRIADLITQFAV